MLRRMKRVLSGIQTSGQPHLGNYLGAYRRFVELQGDYECFFFLADLHAITVPQDPAELRQQVIHGAAVYLACGLDPSKAVLFRQSDIAAHAELAWLLNTIATMGELKRMTQFKDKSAGSGDESIAVGLFDYPVLQAADILLYQPQVVPVGEDQKQHIELTRDLAIRFNHRFGETFSVPEPLIADTGARVMGLDDPTKKMSKSAASDLNYINLNDDPDRIRLKIKKAVTDSGSEVKGGADKPALNNLLMIYSQLTGRPVSEIEQEYEGKGYGDFKAGLAEVIVETLAPIQKRLAEFEKDPAQVEQILAEGAAKARPVAEETLVAAKRAMGLA